MTHLRLLLFWLAVCAVALAGCASEPQSVEPPLPPIRPDTIGRLRVDGPNAFINGVRATTGSYVADGNTVTTGAATSAIVVLNDGGEIQLDADTDPLIRQGVCLIMEMVRGRVALRNLNCQEFKGPGGVHGRARSFVHIEARAEETRVTVLTGEVSMFSPTEATLGPDMQYVALADGTAQVVQLTPEQALATVAWTRNYFRPRAAPGSGLSSTQASLIGGAIGLLLDRVLKRDRGGRPEIRTGEGTQGYPTQQTPPSGQSDAIRIPRQYEPSPVPSTRQDNTTVPPQR